MLSRTSILTSFSIKQIPLWLLAICAGALTPLAFAPFNLWYLIIPCYSCLIYICARTTPGRSGYYGLLFALAKFSIGLYWLFSISAQYPLALDKLTICIILVGILFYQVKPSNICWYILLLPALLTLSEWLRGWLFTGLPWYSAGYAFINPGFSQLLPLTGILGTSYCVYLIAGALSLVADWLKSYLSWTALLIIVATIASGHLLLGNKLATTTPLPDKQFYAQIIHGNFNLTHKTAASSITRIKQYQILTNRAPYPQLSIWPESSASIEFNQIQEQLELGFNALAANNISVLFGTYRQAQDDAHNVILNEQLQRVYSKQHLLPFGEYLPAWLTPLSFLMPDINMGQLYAAPSSAPVSWNELKIASSICFEILFATQLASASRNANFIVNLSDLGWFNNSWAASYLLTNAQARAIESGKPLLYSSNQGVSAFIEYDGSIMQTNTSSDTSAIYQAITPRTGSTWYALWGNYPIIIYCILLLIITGMCYLLFTKNHKN